MLASTGRWPAIYDQKDQPSLAMLSSLVVNNRGNLVIGGDIASDRQPQNHRGPLVWLCHEASFYVVGDWHCTLIPFSRSSENGIQERSLVWVKMVSSVALRHVQSADSVTTQTVPEGPAS
jgi:hypothetical protein